MVITCAIDELEDRLNILASEGWRVISVDIDRNSLYGAVVVLEKAVDPNSEHKN